MSDPASLASLHALAGTGYQLILADPPWATRTWAGEDRVPTQGAAPYATMTLEEICALPVAAVAARDALLVVWTIGSTRYIGTGIGNKDFIAVSYRSGNSSGLALYGAKGDNWDGVWAYSGSKQIGTERWERE